MNKVTLDDLAEFDREGKRAFFVAHFDSKKDGLGFIEPVHHIYNRETLQGLISSDLDLSNLYNVIISEDLNLNADKLKIIAPYEEFQQRCQNLFLKDLSKNLIRENYISVFEKMGAAANAFVSVEDLSEFNSRYKFIQNQIIDSRISSNLNTISRCMLNSPFYQYEERPNGDGGLRVVNNFTKKISYLSKEEYQQRYCTSN